MLDKSTDNVDLRIDWEWVQHESLLNPVDVVHPKRLEDDIPREKNTFELDESSLFADRLPSLLLVPCQKRMVFVVHMVVRLFQVIVDCLDEG